MNIWSCNDEEMFSKTRENLS